ncbi:hypothetical protein PRUPE_1G215500 [Prunus persica]|uniref:Uncharacterized protein n=1 Tax=Prunus persica TaxID=3760 RepID=M5XT24_PRUPE|nr:hypothetical protein PRUPE_1G215500 [Prunus persica]
MPCRCLVGSCWLSSCLAFLILRSTCLHASVCTICTRPSNKCRFFIIFLTKNALGVTATLYSTFILGF